MKSDAKAVLSSVNQLIAAVTGLVSSVTSAASGSSRAAVPARRGRPPSAATLAARAAAESGEAPAPGAKRVGRVAKKSAQKGAKSAKLKASIKAHWAGMSPKERAARVKKMLAGRGLKPKKSGPARKPSAAKAAKSAKLKASIKAHWANMSPADHAARVKKMLAGRGLKPASS